MNQPAVAVNAADGRVVAWRSSTGTTLVVQSADGTEDTDTWSTPANVSVEGADMTWAAQDARVSIEAGGRQVAVWLQANGAGSLVSTGALRPPGGTWSTPVPLSASGEGLAAGSISVASGGGETTAVWASDGVVRARTLSAAGAWSTSKDLSAFAGVLLPTQVARDAAGNAVVVWKAFIGSSKVQGIGLDGGAPVLAASPSRAAGTPDSPSRTR